MVSVCRLPYRIVNFPLHEVGDRCIIYFSLLFFFRECSLSQDCMNLPNYQISCMCFYFLLRLKYILSTLIDCCYGSNFQWSMVIRHCLQAAGGISGEKTNHREVHKSRKIHWGAIMATKTVVLFTPRSYLCISSARVFQLCSHKTVWLFTSVLKLELNTGDYDHNSCGRFLNF